MGKMRFVFRFLALNFFFLALPLLIATSISLVQFYEKTVDQGRKELQQIAKLRTFTLNEWLPAQMPSAKELIYFWKLGKEKPNFAEMSKELEQLVKDHPGYLFAILGPNPALEDFHEILAVSDPIYYKDKEGLFYVNPIYLKLGHGVIMRYLDPIEAKASETRPYLFGLQGFYDDQNQLAGFVVQAADMKLVMEEILSTTNFSYLNFAILNDKSIVMGSSDKELEGHFFDPINMETWKRSVDLGTIKLADQKLQRSTVNQEGFFDFMWDGQMQIACEVQVPEMQLSIMVYTPRAKFFKHALDQYITLYIVYVAILLIGFIFVILVGAWISRSLRQLSGLMDEVGQGKLDVRYTPQAFGYEFNLLGNIFNSTLGSIQNQIQRAEDERVKKQVFQRELTLGREVQKSLFPAEFPEEEGLEMAGCYIPSEKVSGDFYLIEQHKMGILVAMFDVGGKGIHSSLYALSVRSLLRTYATMIDDVGELMSRVNADFAAESDVHATAFVSFIDVKSHKLHYTSCGHLPTLIKRDSDLIELESAGWKLGEKSDATYETKTIDLQKEDQLFIYVDGLTEAVDSLGIPIKIEGVKRVIESKAFATAEEGVEALNRLWEEHTGEKTPADEILILTCRIKS